MQKLWQEYVIDTHACCSSDFWKVYEALAGQTRSCRDSVLSVVKDILSLYTRTDCWPRGSRGLRDRVIRHAGTFWEHVVQTHRIDVSAFKLPGIKSIPFLFVDPVFVFIHQCNELNKAKISLKWDPVLTLHPQTGQRVFGAGIECGHLMHAATQSIPAGGKVALLNVSFDGGDTGYVGRSACPILLQVMNVNSMTPKAVGLLGYMPRVEVDKSIKGVREAKKHVLQTSIGHILDCIEARSRHGFRFANSSQSCQSCRSTYFCQMFAELHNLQFCVLLPIVRRVVNYTILCTTTT